MSLNNKIIKIGFDLDGVIIDKPPLIPSKLIEWLYRSHNKKELSFRYPRTRLEILIRIVSHHYRLRPPIKNNLEYLKDLAKDKRYELYVVSGRYGFLGKKTKDWFKAYGVSEIFKEIHLNLNNEQPHVFKEKILKKLRPDIYFEDDWLIFRYLNKKISRKGIKMILVKDKDKIINLSDASKEILRI